MSSDENAATSIFEILEIHFETHYWADEIDGRVRLIDDGVHVKTKEPDGIHYYNGSWESVQQHLKEKYHVQTKEPR